MNIINLNTNDPPTPPTPPINESQLCEGNFENYLSSKNIFNNLINARCNTTWRPEVIAEGNW